MVCRCFGRFSDRGGPRELGAAPENSWFAKWKFCMWQCFVTPWPTTCSYWYSHSKTRINSTLYQPFLALTKDATPKVHRVLCVLWGSAVWNSDPERLICHKNHWVSFYCFKTSEVKRIVQVWSETNRQSQIVAQLDQPVSQNTAAYRISVFQTTDFQELPVLENPRDR